MLYLVAVILILLPLVAAYRGAKQKYKPVDHRGKFYRRDIIISITVLIALVTLQPELLSPINWISVGRGWIPNFDIVSALSPLFFIPSVLVLLPKNDIYTKNDVSKDEFFGYPAFLLPLNKREFWLFLLYVIIGVIFEEMICRQFLFYALHETVGLKGDILLLIATFLFSVPHIYQGPKGVLGSFILGLVFGKIFQITGNIWLPITFHLANNMTIVLIAFKRMRHLKSGSKNIVGV